MAWLAQQEGHQTGRSDQGESFDELVPRIALGTWPGYVGKAGSSRL